MKNKAGTLKGPKGRYGIYTRGANEGESGAGVQMGVAVR